MNSFIEFITENKRIGSGHVVHSKSGYHIVKMKNGSYSVFEADPWNPPEDVPHPKELSSYHKTITRALSWASGKHKTGKKNE